MEQAMEYISVDDVCVSRALMLTISPELCAPIGKARTETAYQCRETNSSCIPHLSFVVKVYFL